MSIPQRIRDLANKVRNEIYGKDVRESIAESMEVSGESAEEAKERSLEQLDRVDTLIRENPQPSEVVDARGNYPILRDRLNSTDQQLAQTNIKMGEFNDFREWQDNIIEKMKGEFGDRGYNILWNSLLVNGNDWTEAFQTSLDNHSSVYIPEGVYFIDPVIRLNVKDDQRIVLSNNAILKAIPNDEGDYRILNIHGVENVSVVGGVIEGERDEHLGSTGEHGHGIVIRGSKNVKVVDTIIRDCWGDGVYIGRGDGDRNYSENVTLYDVICDNNRRQGISITSVKGLRIINPILKNTNGTNPQAGIDIEPNDTDNELQDIRIVNPRTENNVGGGILIGLHNFVDADKSVDITIENHTDLGSRSGLEVLRVTGKIDGTITVNRPFYEENRTQGIRVRNYDEQSAHLIINTPTVINNNTNDLESLIYGSGIAIYKESGETGDSAIGNVTINNPTVIDNRTEMLNQYGIYVRDHTGKPVKGVEINNPKRLEGYRPLYFDGEGILNDEFDVSKFDILANTQLTRSNWSKTVSNIELDSQKVVALDRGIRPNSPAIDFVMESDVPLVILPEDAVIAPLSNNIGERIRCLQKGGSLTLKKLDGNTWIVENMIGEWELYNPG